MAETPRKKFPLSIERALWTQSGGMCMNPDCNHAIITVEANSLITATFEIAHIYPHSDVGPRWQYLADAPVNRDSLDNLIILCLNCHQKVDSHPEQYPHTYPPELLFGWKAQRKERISSAFQQHLERIKADTGLSLAAQLGAGLYPGQKGLQSKIFERHSLFGGRELPQLWRDCFSHHIDPTCSETTFHCWIVTNAGRNENS